MKVDKPFYTIYTIECKRFLNSSDIEEMCIIVMGPIKSPLFTFRAINLWTNEQENKNLPLILLDSFPFFEKFMRKRLEFDIVFCVTFKRLLWKISNQ